MKNTGSLDNAARVFKKSRRRGKQKDKGMSGMKEQNNAQLLNFRAIMAVGVGCVIGSGIVAITGSAIGVTGRSVWIAYAAAVILGLVCITPFVILGSVLTPGVQMINCLSEDHK